MKRCTVSTSDNNVPGQSYTWTPTGSIPDGSYALGLMDQSGGIVFSHDIVLEGGQASNAASTSSKASVSGAASVSFTGSSAADSTLSSSTPTSVPSNSSAPVTATATLPDTIAPVITTQSPEVQNVLASQRTISHGTVAGIIVGVVVFVLLTTASAILWWRRGRRSSQTAASELPGCQTDAEFKSDAKDTIWIPELGQEGAVHGPHELPGTPNPLEDGTPNPLEETAGANESCLAQGRVFEIAESG